MHLHTEYTVTQIHSRVIACINTIARERGAGENSKVCLFSFTAYFFFNFLGRKKKAGTQLTRISKRELLLCHGPLCFVWLREAGPGGGGGALLFRQ